MARGIKFYSVAKGRAKGVFTSWDDCKAAVNGFPGAVYKGFQTKQEADMYLQQHAEMDSDAPNGRPVVLMRSPIPAHVARSAAAHSTLTETVRQRPASLPAHVTTALPATRSDVDIPPPQRSSRCRVPPLEVYVDGSCLGNGTNAARGGYGAFYGVGDARNISEPLLVSEKQTNNRGELKAMISVLQRCVEDVFTHLSQKSPSSSPTHRPSVPTPPLSPRGNLTSSPRSGPTSPHTDPVRQRVAAPSQWRGSTPPSWYVPLHIFSDSKYCIDGLLQYLPSWRVRKFHNVENVDLWKELDYLVTLRRRIFAHVWDDVYEKNQQRNQQSLEGLYFFTSGTTTLEIDETKLIPPAEHLVLHYVKAHCGIFGNEQADRLAVAGSEKGLAQQRGAPLGVGQSWRSFAAEQRGLSLMSTSPYK